MASEYALVIIENLTSLVSQLISQSFPNRCRIKCCGVSRRVTVILHSLCQDITDTADRRHVYLGRAETVKIHRILGQGRIAEKSPTY
jgi:hypothetical protein